MRFVHAADIHLDSPLRGLDRYEGAPVERLRGATRRAFERLIALCLEERAEFLLLAGDLFDGNWRDYSTGLFFAQEMNRLREAKVPVVLVRGNHDAASQITRHLRLPDNVRELSHHEPETFVLRGLDVAVHGQSFPTRAVTADLAARYPFGDPSLFNIGLLHTSVEGREGHEPYAPCKLETLRGKGYDYWALGHVHAREVLATEPYIVFPGNLQGRHARETGPKGATVVEVSGKHVVSVEHRVMDVVRFETCRVDVPSAVTFDDAVDRARAEIQRAAVEADGRLLCVRVTLRGTSHAHGLLHRQRDRLLAELRVAASDVGGAGAWLEKVVFESRSEEVRVPRDDLAEGPLDVIADELERLRSDPSAFAAAFAELKVLLDRLPPEVASGLDAEYRGEPSRRHELLREVEPLLFGGAGEDGP